MADTSTDKDTDTDKDTENGPLLRVASWNIEFGLRVTEAMETIGQHDELSQADVLLLQEMDEDGVRRIADAIGASYTYAAGSVHRMTGREFGNAVLSRHPLVADAPLRLPHKPRLRGEWRIAVAANIEVHNHSVRVISAHTEIPTLRLKFRIRQFAAVAAAAAQSPTAIIGGDFNTLTGRSVRMLRSVMQDQGLSTVHLPEPVTLRWPQNRSRAFGLHLDHLFSKGVRPVSAGVITTSSGSDHWPLWMTATLPSIDPDGQGGASATHVE